jgi:hypothetical protein
MPPSSLTAALLSPRLLVNTFKHTLRGGISSDPSLVVFAWRSRKERVGKEGISRKKCALAAREVKFHEKRCEVERSEQALAHV